MKLLFVSFLIVFAIGITDAKINSKCPESRTQEADQCAKEGFFLMNPDYKGHEGKDNEAYCTSVNNAVTCIDKFNKDCLKGFTRQSANIGLNGIKKHYKAVCGENAPKKAQFLQSTKFLDRQHMDQLYPCVSSSVKNMNDISDTVKSDQQIPQSCCNYVLTRSCLTKKLKTMTSESNRKFIESLANESLSSLIDFLCANYQNMQNCKKSLPDPMKKLMSNFKPGNGKKEKYESFLIPFLNVLSD